MKGWKNNEKNEIKAIINFITTNFHADRFNFTM